jgi:D-galactose 1-dehydrogenase
MKVAIVGIGHVARHQINAIRRLPGLVELVGAYDSDARASHKRVAPCRFHKSLDDLIENSTADVVVVATPNRDHFATVMRLLSAGRAVMVEKPVCETLEELNKLAKRARAAGLFFHVALHAAFARDLLWWVENRASLTRRFGPVERFHMGFYDPYIERDGAVKAWARGLGGSWVDSGINALSVLERIADPASIRVASGHMFSSPNISCDQIKGSARLECRVDGKACPGEIDTNWTLGLNRKMTILSYKRATVILDHSGQKVVVRNATARPEIHSLQNGLSRLTNQYVGVFGELEQSFTQGRDNIGAAARLHELLFAAAKQRDGKP